MTPVMFAFRCLAAAVLAGISLAAAAQTTGQAPASPKEEQEIRIVGQRLKDALRKRVTANTQTGPSDQIAFWDRQICPRVHGLDKAQADFIVARIAAVAKSVKLRTGKSSCATMLDIVVMPRPQPLARAIAEAFPDRSSKVRAALQRFAESPDEAARWISLTNECGRGCSLPNSRIEKATRPTLQAMVILIEADRLAGVTIGQLSDFIALVALTNPPMGPGTSESILSLFGGEGADRPAGMTRTDEIFLTALYASPEGASAAAQRASIVSRMERELRRKADQPQPKGN